MWTTPLNWYLHYSAPAVNPAGTVYSGWADTPCAYDSATGSELWCKSALGAPVADPIPGSDGVNYRGFSNGDIYALDPDGTEKWTKNPDGNPVNDFSMGDNRILYAATDAGLYAVGGTPEGVPDGNTIAGKKLNMKKSGEDLIFEWGSGYYCDGYVVYRGTLSNLSGGVYDHSDCISGCAGTESLNYSRTGGATESGNYYYLIVGMGEGDGTVYEGPYGRDGSGAERPPAGSACYPQY